MLLPEPEWPTRPIISPGWMTRLMTRVTARVPWRKPTSFEFDAALHFLQMHRCCRFGHHDT